MKSVFRFSILTFSATSLALACGGSGNTATQTPQNTGPQQPSQQQPMMAPQQPSQQNGYARPMQPQQPIPPPYAYSQPAFVYYNGQPNAAPPPPPVQMPPAIARQDPMNVPHLQQAAQEPRRCNVPQEVAPGVFVHVDCYPYRRIPIAVKHATALKLGMMKLGHIRWNAFAPQIAQLNQLGAQFGLPPLPNMPNANGAGNSGAPSNANVPAGGYRAGGSAATAGGGAAHSNDPAQPMPDAVDHRVNGTEGPVKDQGDVGNCTAFALSSVMDNSFRRGNQNITTSPEHVWAHYGIPTMENAATGNLNKGITTFALWGYSGKEACELTRDPNDDCGKAYNTQPNSAANDAPLQAHFQAAEAANGHRVISYEELEVSPVNIDEIISTLASGADLWVAFNIDSSVWTNRKLQNFVVPDWTTPDGGHAVAMAGYRNTSQGRQFLVHNSWGPSWGDGGYAWVSQAMVQKWLHLAYKVRTDIDPGTAPQVPVVPNINVTPAVPVAPTPPKTDEDCPGNQVIDSVSAMCAGICPDQSRPANGQCASGPAPIPLPQQLQLPGLPGGFPIIPIPGWPGFQGAMQSAPPQATPTKSGSSPSPQTPQPQQGALPLPFPSAIPTAWTVPTAWPSAWPMPSGLPQFFPPPPTSQTPPAQH